MKTIAIIPARFASVRLPGKPLLAETGKPLIQHVYERVIGVSTIDDAIVATDDERILDAVKSFGGNVRMTRADHPSGTDRIAEIAEGIEADLVLNVQGDEPELDAAHLEMLIRRMTDGHEEMGTLACPFPEDSDPANPNAVKVVVDQKDRAMYFSRSLIPFPRADPTTARFGGPWLLHVGVYAYRRDTLLEFASWPPTILEQTEKLEQLRALERGVSIAVVRVGSVNPGVDTREDYDAFVRRYRG